MGSSIMVMDHRQALTFLTPSFIHPEVNYWKHEWETIRDCIGGEMDIKAKGTTYLSKLDEMDDKEYRAYLDRAVFFNMVSRTVTGLVGKLFRRPPRLEGVPDKLLPFTETITKSRQDINLFAKAIAEEIFTVGRFGVLLDMDREGKNPPYLTGYIAENIINWSIEEVNGRDVLTEVILREIRLAKNVPVQSSLPPVRRTKGNKTTTVVASTQPSNITFTTQYLASYRVLRLEDDGSGNMIYRQYFYENQTGHATPYGEPTYVITPTRRGLPFNEIPFVFFGPKSNEPDIEKSPVQDIARLNISHYKSYAQLEHGRFYTGLPVYAAKAGTSGDMPEYTIGPGVVWILPTDGDAKILEFNGQGLKFLENALSQKEMQAATLGGRLMGVTMESTAESDNALKLKESNEHALLLNVSDVLDYGLTKVLRMWGWWQDMTPAQIAEINYETSKSFIFDQAAAREFRAIHAMYKDNVIPVQVLYDYLRKAEVIPEWMKQNEFIRLLDSEEGFPGNVDAIARRDGLPDAKSKIQIEESEKDRQLQREEAEKDRETQKQLVQSRGLTRQGGNNE